MRVLTKVRRNVGLTLHVLIGFLLLFAGASKAFGFAPAEVVSDMARYGLSDQMRLIGFGELITVLLLLIPRTQSLGILLTSALWGGIICIHMANGESYVFPSVLLLLSWVGSFLRHPQTFGSFATSSEEDAARSGVRAVGPEQVAVDPSARIGLYAEIASVMQTQRTTS